MKIWFRINGFEFCSWFIVYRHLMKAFRAIGMTIPRSPFNPPQKVDEYIELQWADPALWNWSSEAVRLRVGFALSEHRSLLDVDKALPNLQRCDVLICPCQSAAQAFYELPLDMPIEIVPFGVDDEILTYHERDWNSTLRFLLIGVTQFRKGSWLALEAFKKAFGESKDVELTIASFIETPMFQALQNEYGSDKNINFMGRANNVEEYYNSHHILVSSHLSEGWGLSIPEAMATGMSAIVSRCSAPREYFSTRYGWWIEMSEMYAPVDQCLHNIGGSWRLPDIDSLVEKMIYVVEHRNECKAKGQVASEYVLSTMTWKQSAKKIKDILVTYL